MLLLRVGLTIAAITLGKLVSLMCAGDLLGVIVGKDVVTLMVGSCVGLNTGISSGCCVGEFSQDELSSVKSKHWHPFTF